MCAYLREGVSDLTNGKEIFLVKDHCLPLEEVAL